MRTVTDARPLTGPGAGAEPGTDNLTDQTSPAAPAGTMRGRCEALQVQLAGRVQAMTTSQDWLSWVRFSHAMTRHSRSILNQAYIWSQDPLATYCLGFHGWRKHGRWVRKGEKAIKIWAPVTKRTDDIEDGSERTIAGFRIVSIFDVRQTDGRDLPEPEMPILLAGDAPELLWSRLASIVSDHGFTLQRGPCGMANGLTNFTTRVVRVRDDVDPAQATKTLAHEVGHLCFDSPIAEAGPVCRGHREVRAETFASIVCELAGLSTASYSVPYVSHWFSPRAFAPDDPLLAGDDAPMGCAVDTTATGVYSSAMRFRAARLVLSDGGVSWTVVGHDGVPIDAAEEFLAWRSLRSSPLTVRRYAYALAAFFDFLGRTGAAWEQVTLPVMAGFVSEQRAGGDRAPSTVNTTVAGVVAFYEFQIRHGCDVASQLAVWRQVAARRFKPLLAGLVRGNRQRMSPLALAEPKHRPRIVTSAEFAALLDACSTSRDRFLLSLLHATGMRIGQALGLWHRDMRTWEGALEIVPREANPNGARAKTREVHTVHVPIEIGRLYSDYVADECADIDSEFVFVSLHGRNRGRPWSYRGVDRMVRTLRARTGIDIRLHALRHTHATDLLRAGVPIEIASKRLTHTSVSTTADIYAHLDDEDIASQMRSYWSRRQGS